MRRALEALLDLGRHVLAKGFGDAPAEYKEVARQLGERDVLTPDEADTFIRMAGYRNRLESLVGRFDLSLEGSALRAQIRTDPRYATFLERAERRNVLGLTLPVARLEDVLQGKVGAVHGPDTPG